MHFLHVQIQQLGALLRSRVVTSVELVRIYTERLRRCVGPVYPCYYQALPSHGMRKVFVFSHSAHDLQGVSTADDSCMDCRFYTCMLDRLLLTYATLCAQV